MDVDEAKLALTLGKAIQDEAAGLWAPPAEGTIPRRDLVLLRSITKGTRGYIEKVVHQVNGTYEGGHYDACAVMIRRLVETLIIETFEQHQMTSQIKTANGDFFYLNDLIIQTLACTKWNLSRNTKQALPRLKDVGDKSAHNRYFNAHRGDIDKVAADLRVVAQELINIAGLK